MWWGGRRGGSDAFSIKDIIRLVQQKKDPEKTDQLKAIMLQTGVSDAEKLELASTLSSESYTLQLYIEAC